MGLTVQIPREAFAAPDNVEKPTELIKQTIQIHCFRCGHIYIQAGD